MLPKLWPNLLVSIVESTFSKLFKFTLDTRCQLQTWHFKSHFMVHSPYAAELCQPDNYPVTHLRERNTFIIIPQVTLCCMDPSVIEAYSRGHSGIRIL